MGSDKRKSVEEVIRDIYDQTKPEVEKFFHSVESIFDIRFKGNEAAKQEEAAGESTPAAGPAPSNGFAAAAFRWSPDETYVIDASDRLVVTGTVIFDDRLGFTKSYNFTTGELRIQDSRELASIVSARLATNEERELLLPTPSIDEALEVFRRKIATPQDRKAFDVIKSAVGARDESPEAEASAAGGATFDSAPGA